MLFDWFTSYCKRLIVFELTGRDTKPFINWAKLHASGNKQHGPKNQKQGVNSTFCPFEKGGQDHKSPDGKAKGLVQLPNVLFHSYFRLMARLTAVIISSTPNPYFFINSIGGPLSPNRSLTATYS